MSNSALGWSYPPGVSKLPGDEDPIELDLVCPNCKAFLASEAATVIYEENGDRLIYQCRRCGIRTDRPILRNAHRFAYRCDYCGAILAKAPDRWEERELWLPAPEGEGDGASEYRGSGESRERLVWRCEAAVHICRRCGAETDLDSRKPTQSTTKGTGDGDQ